MTFALLPPTDSQTTLDRVNWLMGMYNGTLDQTITALKNQWLLFWDADLSQADMQAQLDLLASTPAMDQGESTNALAAYFAKALRLIAFVSIENPDAFADSVKDVTGDYKKYLTPGWLYTQDPTTGRIVVSAPCQWTAQ